MHFKLLPQRLLSNKCTNIDAHVEATDVCADGATTAQEPNNLERRTRSPRAQESFGHCHVESYGGSLHEIDASVSTGASLQATEERLRRPKPRLNGGKISDVHSCQLYCP
jgi:hypothetical protein